MTLERSFNGGVTWKTIQSYQTSTEDVVFAGAATTSEFIFYRFRCVSYSGTGAVIVGIFS